MVTVEISEPVWRDLMLKKNPGESFDDVLRREYGLGSDDTTEDAPEPRVREEEPVDEPHDPLDELEFPSGRGRDECLAAIEAAAQYLEEEGSASMREIVAAVLPEHPIGYDVPELEDGGRYRGAWWRRVVKPGLETLDGPEKPSGGRRKWRWNDQVSDGR